MYRSCTGICQDRLEIWLQPDLSGLPKQGQIPNLPELKSGTTVNVTHWEYANHKQIQDNMNVTSTITLSKPDNCKIQNNKSIYRIKHIIIFQHENLKLPQTWTHFWTNHCIRGSRSTSNNDLIRSLSHCKMTMYTLVVVRKSHFVKATTLKQTGHPRCVYTSLGPAA